MKEMTPDRCLHLTEGPDGGSARVKVRVGECGNRCADTRKKSCRPEVKDQRSGRSLEALAGCEGLVEWSAEELRVHGNCWGMDLLETGLVRRLCWDANSGDGGQNSWGPGLGVH